MPMGAPPLTIIPIFRREMVAAARQWRLYAERRAIGSMLFVIVCGSFAAWWYWAGGVLDSGTMARIWNEALRWGVGFQGGIAGSILIRGALSIARERERRTLDFLVATPLSSAEIVLGKLAACAAISVGTMGVGLPIMLLLHSVGGVELRLIGLMYAALAAMGFFLGAMAIWISAETPDRRIAGGVFMLLLMTWLIGPFSVTVFLPRWGIRLPAWLAAANWWLVSSSPVVIVFHIATGLRSWDRLVEEVARLMALQAGAAVLFTVAAIARLRPAYRALTGLARPEDRKARRRLVWRWRPRLAVGDDPILWREMYTSRIGGFTKGYFVLLYALAIAALIYVTGRFAGPAFAELWHNGYGFNGETPAEAETNLFIRWFMPGTRAGGPIDVARMDFNLLIRYITAVFSMLVSFRIAIGATETIGSEKTRETWTSLLTTPLEPRDILRAAMLASLWRARGDLAIVLVLWILGLAAGAIHPLGLVMAVLLLASSTWFLLAYGAMVSVGAKDMDEAAGRCVLLATVLVATAALTFLLPAGLNSLLWSVGATPIMLWTSLLSYREVAALLHAPLQPSTFRAGLLSGQWPLTVLVSWVLAIVGPALAGLWAWRSAVTRFDRWVGRPHRAGNPPRRDAVTPSPGASIARPAANPTLRGCPLAEADGAV